MGLKYEELVKLYKILEGTTKKNLMTALLARFLSNIPEDSVFPSIRLILGKIFMEWEEKEIGLGDKLVMRAISIATGVNKKDIEKMFVKIGDLGEVARRLAMRRRQVTLFRETLTVEKVYNTLRKIAEKEGEGSIDIKVRLLANLLVSANPDEVKYIIRTILEELRVGVGEGIVRDAISKAFNVPVDLVERAYFLTCDYALVAEIAKKEGLEGLKKIKVEVGRPLKVMLAQVAKDIPNAFSIVGSPAAVEVKYDGIRAQIHKKGKKVIIFTRRLNEITNQFPEVVSEVLKCIKADEVIVEGEIVAWDVEKDRPRPFQVLSRRVQRKYDIYKAMKEIPVKTFLFDIIYVNGKDLLDRVYEDRYETLKSILEESDKLMLSKRIITSSFKEAEDFYNKALEEGHEGVMFKNLKAKYQAGKRVGYMVKLKPIMETLDCVIVAGEWGEGRRSQWLTSYYVAVKEPDTGKLLVIGRTGSGLTEEQYEELTKRLLELKIKEVENKVIVKPKIVLEVAFQEIEKSPKYDSGFALRFPRVVRIREDKSVEEIDDINRVKELFELFSRKKGEF